MADVEKININSTDYDIADAKALRNKDVNSTSFIDTKAGTTTYPTDNINLSKSIIIGKDAYHTSATGGTRNVIIGNEAYGGASYQTTVGESAHCGANSYTTAIGYDASASSSYSTALGASSRAGNMGSVAIGYSTSASTQYSTVVGYGASAGGNSYNMALGANAAASAQYATAVGASANASASRSAVLGYGSSATQQYTTAIGSGAVASSSYSVQLGQGTNTNYGSLQFRSYPLVDNGGKIYEERIPSTVRFATNEPTILDWQDDEELKKLMFIYTGEDNDLFKHGLCYQATTKQGYPKSWCGWANTDFIPRNECVQIDQEKLFLKLAEISKARYLNDGDWRNSLIGGDNAEQDFCFYYNVNDAQWHIEISNDTLEMGFTGTPDYYYFEQGETLEDFGIYVKDLTLPTDEDAEEEMIDIYYYAPVYCDGYSFGSDLSSVNYIKLMQGLNDSDWGFGKVIGNMQDWEYEVDGTTYYMPVIPEIYISKQDSEEYDGVTIRWEWDYPDWKQYINGEYSGYDWSTAQLGQTFGIVLDASEEDTEYIEFYFRGAKQLYWEQFDPVDMSHFTSAAQFATITTDVNKLKEWGVNVVTTNNADLNNYTTNGWYYFTGSNVINKPSSVSNNTPVLVLVLNYLSYTKQILFSSYTTSTIGGVGYSTVAPSIFHRCHATVSGWDFWQVELSQYSANFLSGYNNDKQQKLVHTTNSARMQWADDTNSVVDSPRNIGEIVESSIPLTDAGLHLLDGTLISGSGSYSAFVTYIAGLYNSGDYTDIFETEANWQTAVSTYGVCDKYVYDSVNNTVRLPKYGNQIFTKDSTTTSTIPVKGNGVSLGLTNGTDNYAIGYNASGNPWMFTSMNNYGNSYGSSMPTTDYPTQSRLTVGVTTDSTKSGLVADTSSLLTEYPLTAYYYVVIATATKTEIEVDIDEIATDLNGKADVDLTNLSSTQSINFDGQWIDASTSLASGATPPTTVSSTFSLSSYLPNDGHNYEVLFTAQTTTGSTSGNQISIALKTDIITSNVYICKAQTRASSSVGCFGSCIIPVGTGRSVTVDQYGNNTGTYTLQARGYRRIGTNS